MYEIITEMQSTCHSDILHIHCLLVDLIFGAEQIRGQYHNSIG